MRHTIPTLIVLFVLGCSVGCSRTPKANPVSAKLDRWVGQPASTLVARLGEPSTRYKTHEGLTVLGFSSSKNGDKRGCLLVAHVNLYKKILQAFWSGPEGVCREFIPATEKSP